MRLPAEWEPQGFVQLTWPHKDSLWYEVEKVQDCYTRIVTAILRHEPVLMVCRDQAECEEDLRRCEREKLRKALDALIEMQEEFWQREELYGSAFTLEQSLVGIENRGRYLGSKRLEEVYAAFVRIYQTTPRTLCHDDLLPFNLLIGERAVLIDWEYGGLLPYPTSFARLIAHGREEEGAFFYMTREDRNFAIQYYYDGLIKKHGIPYAEYRRTLDYFLFYEYCEWVMLGNRYNNRSDERYGYYLKLAEELAEKLVQQENNPVFQGKYTR